MSPAAITAIAFLALTLLAHFGLPRLHAALERKQEKAITKLAPVLLADPDRRHFGYALSRKAGVRSGVLYPVLSRMLEQGLLSCGWETEDEAAGRPPRRWYRLTDAGRALLPYHQEAS